MQKKAQEVFDEPMLAIFWGLDDTDCCPNTFHPNHDMAYKGHLAWVREEGGVSIKL